MGGLLVLASLWLPPTNAQAQFDGNFEVEEHFLDDENFLDWQAYQLSRRWRRQGLVAANRFQATVGSLSPTRFYVEEELRLEADFHPAMTFLYSQQETSLFRTEPLYREAELRVGDGVYGSLIGWVEQDKRRNDVGYALALGERTDWSFIRFSRLEQFRFFNEKNDSSKNGERFEQIPIMQRLEVRHYWDWGLLLDANWVDEGLSEFREIENGITRTYKGMHVDLWLDWQWHEQAWMGLRYLRDVEYREQLPDRITQSTPDLGQRIYLQWIELSSGISIGRHDFTFGALDAEFVNRIHSSQVSAIFSTSLDTRLVFGTWEPRPDDRMHGLFGLYSGRAKERRRHADEAELSGNEVSLQVKAAAGLVFQEAERYRVLFNSTWDLDIIARRAWDGGNVQVQVFF